MDAGFVEEVEEGFREAWGAQESRRGNERCCRKDLDAETTPLCLYWHAPKAWRRGWRTGGGDLGLGGKETEGPCEEVWLWS
jgi:hypothetical protein